MDYKPPKAVQAEARRALQWIEDGHAGQGFTDTGRKRASDLARGAAVSRDTIGRIANYLARHESDKQGKGWSPGDEGYPSPGRVAWAAWGGDPAKTWTAGILKSEEKSARDGCECWDGYCRVPGTQPCEPGSCEKCDAHRACEDEESERSGTRNGAGMTAMALRNRERILDVREERSGATPFEFREDADTGYVILRGYAATYEPYDCYGGPDAGGWVEQLRANAFDRTLQAQPDVMLLLNHTGAPLARTKSGTMSLSVDRRGLVVEARLDPSDPDVQALLPKMRRGDLDEMSFAFRVKDQEWNADYTHRTITEVSLQKGDVSVVNYGMNPNTRVAIAEGTVGALASLSQGQLAELRRLDTDLIERAISNLSRVTRADKMKDDEECAMDDKHPEPDADEVGGPPDGDTDDTEKKSCDCCGEDPCECDDQEEKGDDLLDPKMQYDARAAAALDETILVATSLAKDNPALQRRLKEARAQLNKLRGFEDGKSDVDAKLLALRAECGLPNSSNVEDALGFIKRNGIDPATSLPFSYNTKT